MPPLVACSRRIGPTDAMGITVAVVSKTQLLASNYHTFLLANLSIFIAQKGLSTHVINATSFLTMWDATIQKEVIRYISSYQTLTVDRNLKSY
jgi:hypothetical protein